MLLEIEGGFVPIADIRGVSMGAANNGDGLLVVQIGQGRGRSEKISRLHHYLADPESCDDDDAVYVRVVTEISRRLAGEAAAPIAFGSLEPADLAEPWAVGS